MNELQRQSYLKAMGLTPWVARQGLPGAAPSPQLDWPEPSPESSPSLAATAASAPAAAPVAATPEPESESPAAPSLDTTSLSARLAAGPVPSKGTASGKPATPPSTPTPEPVQAAPAPSATSRVAEQASGKTLTFTLEAHLAGEVWVLAAQEDSQAPGLGRFEAPLLQNLLAVFGGDGRRPWRFFCPLTEVPMVADEAQQALAAFVSSLQQRSGGERLLLCLPEALSMALFQVPRYQLFSLAELPALVVSSLAEMLAVPAEHKKRSWAAIQEQGFAN